MPASGASRARARRAPRGGRRSCPRRSVTRGRRCRHHRPDTARRAVERPVRQARRYRRSRVELLNDAQPRRARQRRIGDFRSRKTGRGRVPARSAHAATAAADDASECGRAPDRKAARGGRGKLSCDGRSVRLANARLCESADRLRVALDALCACRSYAAAAACRCRQRPRARFGRDAPSAGAGSLPGMAGVFGPSLRLFASHHGPGRLRPPGHRPAARGPVGVRAAAAWPCRLVKPPSRCDVACRAFAGRPPVQRDYRAAAHGRHFGGERRHLADHAAQGSD